MNCKIEIKNTKNDVVYKGDILDLPIKEEYIIQKSIEMFDDDDPCIIHRSYVVKEIVNGLLTEVKENSSKEIKLSKYRNEDICIDIPDIEECILSFL